MLSDVNKINLFGTMSFLGTFEASWTIFSDDWQMLTLGKIAQLEINDTYYLSYDIKKGLKSSKTKVSQASYSGDTDVKG